jgi:hypothetical protein
MFIKYKPNKKRMAFILWTFLVMKKVVLIFPDVRTMTEFVLRNKIAHAEVNTREVSLTSFLSENEIATACNWYNASLLNSIMEISPL